jgi:penicillin-binding protein 1A
MIPENPPKPFLQKIRETLLLQKKWFKRLVIFLWVFLLVVIVGGYLYIQAVIANPYDLFGEMPSLRAIENPENDLSTEIISADGVSLGREFRYNRSRVTYDDLSPLLVNTLLASEDHRFYEHSGIDLHSWFRVVFGVLTFNSQGGGSTLSQQTAKNLYSTRAGDLQGKLSRASGLLALAISKTKEWIIGVELEKNFTKEEIIALYLNTVPFNNNAYGIQVASETYFNKNPADLNVQECALLVGMLQGTSWFNPVLYPERTIKKRNEVIQKLLVHHHLKTQAEADSLKALPLSLNFSVQDHNVGPAPYFRSILKGELMQWCKDNGYDLFESGLKVYTTIDSRMQHFAEEAMKEHMGDLQGMFEKDWGDRNPWVDDNKQEIKNFLARKIKRTETYRNLVARHGENKALIEQELNQKKRMKIFSWSGTRDTLFSSYDSLRYYNRFLHSGLMAMNPETGEVKAWVGGIDHRYFQFDHVRQAKRQPGSTFKAFVYGEAMEEGYSPCHEFYDNSPNIMVNGKLYHPKNANGTYGDGKPYTLRRGMARSLNSISVQLIDALRPQNVADFAKKLGITTPITPVHSLALGTSNVSLYDMVAAYSSFVNMGVYTKPYYITRIEDKNGNVLESFVQNTKQVMDEVTAYKMIHMLKGGVEESGGTSQALSAEVKVENEIGGKTGTTDNGSDGWYMGITHNLVTGVWVGGDEPSIHFPNWGEGSGGKTALPIWDKFMKQVYRHTEAGYMKGRFRQPMTEPDMTFDCDKHQQDSTFQVVY